MHKKGFTLIEILVVLAITAMLSAIAIVYSRVGQNQISLSIESSKIAELILEAKELSIATYSENAATCAYGVHFDFTQQTYSLFAYNTSSTNGSGRPLCPSIASTTDPTYTSDLTQNIGEYESGSWQVHIAQGVLIESSTLPASDTLQDVLFYTPDPTTLVSLDGSTFVPVGSTPAESNIYLETVSGDDSVVISVNPEGQVNL
jgi:prepilin-type N-terminal cleavage/methylation domain-containing protein